MMLLSPATAAAVAAVAGGGGLVTAQHVVCACERGLFLHVFCEALACM
jgi:hypothetical protein